MVCGNEVVALNGTTVIFTFLVVSGVHVPSPTMARYHVVCVIGGGVKLDAAPAIVESVSYTHLTLPTNTPV